MDKRNKIIYDKLTAKFPDLIVDESSFKVYTMQWCMHLDFILRTGEEILKKFKEVKHFREKELDDALEKACVALKAIGQLHDSIAFVNSITPEQIKELDDTIKVLSQDLNF